MSKDHQHDYKESYYGWQCACGYFIPFGEEPWMPDPEPDPSDFCPHCGKEYEDFSDLGCEYCDVRHPAYGVL